MTSWLIFSDLDETLLDRDRYSFDEARPALAEVRRRGIPLVLVTSKTAAETLQFRTLLGLREPMIVESGCGVYLPRGYFREATAGGRERGDDVLHALAVDRSEVLRGLDDLKRRTGGSLRGFSDMTAEEVAAETGLSREMAAAALEREFDEPFKFVRREAEFAALLPGWAAERGLRLLEGARFYHLHGQSDKGRAMKEVAAMFRRERGEVRTLALGDSPLDLPMLSAADVAVAIPGKDGTPHPSLVRGVPGIITVAHRGPVGWNEAVLAALEHDA